jgi:hypothetical protein
VQPFRKARLSVNYARFFLENGSPPGASSLVDAVGTSTNVGDYTLQFHSVDTRTIKINASGKPGVEGTNSALWLVPR